MNDTGGDSDNSLDTGGDSNDSGTTDTGETTESDVGEVSSADGEKTSASDALTSVPSDAKGSSGGGVSVEYSGVPDVKGTGISSLEHSAMSKDTKSIPETGRPETVTWLNNTVLLKSDYNSSDKVTEESLQTIDHNAKIVAVEHAKRSAPDRTEALDRMLAEPSKAHVGAMSSRVAGSRNMESGEIMINRELSNKAAEHSDLHEHMHEASYQRSDIVETETQKIEATISGIHSLVTLTDKTDSGKIETHDFHRALNEGITEWETLAAEREVYGFEKGKEFHCYSTNVDYASQLADIIGDETIRDAYYNGNLERMSTAVNDLAKDETAFKALSAKLDDACKGYDMSQLTPEQQEATKKSIEAAKTELDSLLARMAQTKAEIDEMKSSNE